MQTSHPSSINQTLRKTLHPNTLSRALRGLCTVSARYLIEGSTNKLVLIIRYLDIPESARFYVFQNPFF
jgi:hypothetical protein